MFIGLTAELPFPFWTSPASSSSLPFGKYPLNPISNPPDPILTSSQLFTITTHPPLLLWCDETAAAPKKKEYNNNIRNVKLPCPRPWMCLQPVSSSRRSLSPNRPCAESSTRAPPERAKPRCGSSSYVGVNRTINVIQRGLLREALSWKCTKLSWQLIIQK